MTRNSATRAVPRRTRRARTIVAVVVSMSIAVTAWVLATPLPDGTGAQGSTLIALPDAGAAAVRVSGADDVFGTDAATMLSSRDADARYPIASISKVITALVILRAHPLANIDDAGPIITYSDADAAVFDHLQAQDVSVVPMAAGGRQTLRDALATMLVPSASNYAEVLARWAFGSTEEFAAAARAWLDEHDLRDTTMVEPTGISTDNSSTPRDLLEIGSIAAADPIVSAIASWPTITLLDGSAAENTNTLLGVDGVTGLKTGNLGAGAYALLYSARIEDSARRSVLVIGIVLGGQSRESVAESVRETLASVRNELDSA